jgi:hypothetical protein
MIEKNYSANKALLTENNDLISLQLTLVNFLEKHKESIGNWVEEGESFAETDMSAYLDDNELFELTIKGKLGFEQGHPRFNDEAFFNKLLSYYSSIEAYEKCNAMLMVRRKDEIR